MVAPSVDRHQNQNSQISDNENQTSKQVLPLATCKFRVEIENIIIAAFSECTGLEITNEVFEYQEGGLNEYTHKLLGRIKYSNVTLKRGFAVSNELYNWFNVIKDRLLAGRDVWCRKSTNSDPDRPQKPNPESCMKKVTITLFSTSTQEEFQWTLNDAFPVKWAGPSFNAGEAATAVETLELAHHGIIVTSNKK